MHHPGTGTVSPDNRAWRRFTTLTGEHFDVVDWAREDARLVMITLIDLGSGDAVSLAIIDSVEDNQPHVSQP